MSSDASDAEIAKAKAEMEFLVTPSQLYQTLEHCLSSVTPDGESKEQANVMVWGAMGIGKTDVCRTLGIPWKRRIVSLHLPQYDPTDLKGIPIFLDDKGNSLTETDSNGKVRWIPSSYLPQFIDRLVDEDCEEATFGFDWPDAEEIMVHIYAPDGKVVCRANDLMNGVLGLEQYDVVIDEIKGTVVVRGDLPRGTRIHIIDLAIIFLDELSAAVPEVQNAALQLVLDKRVGEYNVPPFTPLIAAGNRESDQAFVSPMSMPLCNRFMHLRLIHSVEDWMDWAYIKRIDPAILGYIQWKKHHLFHFEPDTITEGDCGFPTPRSWAKLSEQMKGMEHLPESIQNAIITGYVGKAIGQQFIEHRKVAHLLPSTDDVLRGKEPDIPDDLNVGARYHLALGLCYALADYHEQYFDEALGQDAEFQCDEWQVATNAFCEFIHDNLGMEMTVLCVHIASRHLDISFVKFRSPKFTGFAKKYRNIIRRTI
jgi:MoxR-like ATPase